MSNEGVRVEAKAWLQDNKDADLGSLDRGQSQKLLSALYAAGAEVVWVLNPVMDEREIPWADTLHIKAGHETVAHVMSRLANFHPDETELLKDEPGCHTIRAWWD